MLNERLDQIESEIVRTNARRDQLLKEVQETRQRVAAFIGTAPPAAAVAAGIVTMAELERAAILHAVAVCRDRHAAAEALGIGKTTLYRKLAEYGSAAGKQAAA
jgi:DNA-binding NtrC family response regulator